MDRPDTSIQNLMQRTFQFVIAVMLIASCCSQACAQGTFPRNAYTIIGDVGAPNTYEWQPGQGVSLQMVLQRARALGPSGRAIIRKTSQPSRVNQVSIWTNLENAIRLNPGDTVVWQSIKGSNLQNGNVALLTDRGTKLQSIPITGVDLGTLRQQAGLRFDQPVFAHRNGWGRESSFRMDSNTEGVQHGDVLDIRASMIRVVATPVFRPQAGSQLATGIVKTASHPIQAKPQSPFAEVPNRNQNQNTASNLRVPPAPQFHQAAGSSAITMPAALPYAGNTLQIPESPFNRTGDSGVPVDPSPTNQAFFEEVGTPGVAGASTSADSTTALDQLADEAINPTAAGQENSAQSFLSGIFLFGLVLAIGLITAGIVRTRQEQRLHEQTRVVMTSHQTARAPEANDMEEQGQATLHTAPTDFSQLPAESITQLPAFSVEPLAKPDSTEQSESHEAVFQQAEGYAAEIDTELENCPVLSAGLEESDTDIQKDNVVEAVPFTSPVFDQPKNTTINEVAEESAENNVTAHAAVDLTPWLTDDPAEGTRQETFAEQAPPAQEVAAEILEQHAADDLSNQTVTLQQLDTTVTALQDTSSEDLILELPDVDEVRNALALKEQVSKSTTPAIKLETGATSETTLTDQIDIDETVVEAEAEAIDSPQTIQDQEDIMAHPPMTQAEAQYLEDLIQNRLPMELSENQLPLKISLFGKPEGPRRLRIDAAHSTIAPPHMASTASRSKRREPAMAMRNDAVKPAAKQAARPESSSSSDTSSPSQTTTASPETDSRTQNSPAADSATPRPPQVASQNETSGLDKALNFLEEQSKS